MKSVLFLLFVFILSNNAYSQFVYKIKADSVLITNDSCTAELIVENSTKDIKGFLFNKGNGRTEFRRPKSITDSSFIIGDDTIVIHKTNSTPVNIYNSNGTLTANRTVSFDGFTLNFDGNTGFGITPAAKLHSVSTTEPLRVGYDNSNYLKTVVSSTGLATMTAIGTSPSVSIANSLRIGGDVTQTGSTYNFPAAKLVDEGSSLDIRATSNRLRFITMNGASTLMDFRPGTFDFYNSAFSLAVTIDPSNSRYKGILGLAYIDLYNPSTGNIDFVQTSTHAMRWLINGAEAMRLVNGGYLGFGTTSPTQRVHVKGQIQVDTVLTGTNSDSLLVVNGGLIKKISSVALNSGGSLVVVNDANYNVAATINCIIYSNLSADRTVTLPSASTSTDREITIKNSSGSGFAINLSVAVKESLSINVSSIANANWITIKSDGTDWWIKASK